MKEAMAAEVAGELEQAFAQGPAATQEAMRQWLGPEVELRHEPAEPADGFYPADVLLQALSQRLALFTRLMPDYSESAVVTSEGAQIVVDLVIRGTLSDGSRIDIPGRDRLTVREGRIVAMLSAFDAERMRPLVEAVRAL
ncbi:hypothetical protein LWF15_08075 [Kineosporia rhizophila]|uniref:hypothetical protein n=1 Tax=Kineosporia rhizophila TaxID=84633 RepID=UPI000AC248E6|nr:hypothetical protein [Kineosporia rhizophila]MCE0535463.1 hypothetical protein [Kineosporia rhizophila]